MQSLQSRAAAMTGSTQEWMRTLMTPTTLLGMRIFRFACAGWALTGLMAAGASHAAMPDRLSADQARHLLLRTGFAPRQAEVDALTGQPARQAISEVIGKARTAAPSHPPPGFVSQPPPLPARLLQSAEERQAQRRQLLREGLDIKVWWMREMLESPAPLEERMTLFWHSHFATSQQKVVSSLGMWRQHLLLRQGALGSFRSLLHAIAKDPAMLVYLDGANSRKEAPNENFAREVMELFTLGEASRGGRYTESDIREAARAFTGWSVEPGELSFRYRPAFHDRGEKTVLGRSGDWGGDAVLDILLDQPAAATHIVGKLWKEFVSPTPDNDAVERIARRFRASDYDIAAALTDLLQSDAFWADANRGSLIKSPVDLVVGTLRQFDFSYADALPFVLKTAQLGQNLLAPPNVKGWPGQNDWINATTLLERKRFTEQMFRAAGAKAPADTAAPVTAPGMAAASRPAQAMAGIGFDPERWLSQYGGAGDQVPSEELKARLAHTLLALPAIHSIADGTVGTAYLRGLTLDPAYQLK